MTARPRPEPRPAIALALVLSAALVVVAPAARAAVQPDPGNAAAWATGLALLAEPPGALALFDQPAALAAAPGRHVALGAARATPFGLEALARTRVAVATARGALVLALGVEAYGPPEARRTRLGFGIAGRRVTDGRALAAGAAWHEARLASSGPDGANASARSGALDAGVVFEAPGRAVALAVRSLAAGGAPPARADPDWTAEARVDAPPARLHAALTHDLAGTRIGGGLSLAAGPVTVRAGAFGAPWTWGLGVVLGGAGRAHLAATRTEHPALGPSGAWQGDVSW